MTTKISHTECREIGMIGAIKSIKLRENSTTFVESTAVWFFHSRVERNSTKWSETQYRSRLRSRLEFASHLATYGPHWASVSHRLSQNMFWCHIWQFQAVTMIKGTIKQLECYNYSESRPSTTQPMQLQGESTNSANFVCWLDPSG